MVQSEQSDGCVVSTVAAPGFRVHWPENLMEMVGDVEVGASCNDVS